MKSYGRYLYAILAVPVAVLLRFALLPLTGHGTPYVTLFPVTVAVALLAGLGPAILTGVLGSIVIDYFFIPPLYLLELNVEGLSRMAVVVLTSAYVGYAGELLRAARAKAEQQAIELRESQNDLNRAQTVAHTGSWRLDVRRNELTWSDEAYHIFGVPKGTPLTYESFLSFIHPDDRKYVDDKWKAALAGWRKLQTSDHFYYMCTKWFSDGDVHKYFNPYNSPYEAYINFMNVLDNLDYRCIVHKNKRAQERLLTCALTTYQHQQTVSL